MRGVGPGAAHALRRELPYPRRSESGRHRRKPLHDQPEQRDRHARGRDPPAGRQTDRDHGPFGASGLGRVLRGHLAAVAEQPALARHRRPGERQRFSGGRARGGSLGRVVRPRGEPLRLDSLDEPGGSHQHRQRCSDPSWKAGTDLHAGGNRDRRQQRRVAHAHRRHRHARHRRPAHGRGQSGSDLVGSPFSERDQLDVLLAVGPAARGELERGGPKPGSWRSTRPPARCRPSARFPTTPTLSPSTAPGARSRRPSRR